MNAGKGTCTLLNSGCVGDPQGSGAGVMIDRGRGRGRRVLAHPVENKSKVWHWMQSMLGGSSGGDTNQPHFVATKVYSENGGGRRGLTL